MKKIKVAIADDHKLFRSGVISLLGDFNEIGSIVEAENGKELLDKISANPPDVILLDLNMPVMGGNEVLAELQRRKSPCKAIIITMYEDENFILNAIRSGARGFLSKNAEPDEIILAIQSVNDTGYYFNDSMNQAMLKRMLKQETINPVFPDAPIDLNEREQQVLRLISDEKSNIEIAEQLFISIRTVEAVRQKLIEKFGAKNSVGLVLSAAKRGFIQL